jgi:hypothetical protein
MGGNLFQGQTRLRRQRMMGGHQNLVFQMTAMGHLNLRTDRGIKGQRDISVPANKLFGNVGRAAGVNFERHLRVMLTKRLNDGRDKQRHQALGGTDFYRTGHHAAP